ncbi:MAG: thermonuclease family protein [Candidatus Omnitrophica bacterium]|nr:thermonuclease family protein [Candidatus Omnitrophota bacterium]
MRSVKPLPIFLFFLVLSSCAPPDYSNILVTKAIDGDTLRLATGEKLRLIGIDTPEMYESEKLYRDAASSGEDISVIIARGRESHRFTQDLVENKTVSIEFDEEKYDDYGRLLGYAFLADGTFINAEIVKEGYAIPLTIRPNVRYADYIYRLYWQARQAKKGLWQ